MDTDGHDVYCIFRTIGSIGIVIFEQDDTLLRRETLPGGPMLGDINDELVEMLKQLREQNVRFGFISDPKGMVAASDGWSEYAALTRILDGLLTVRGAMPDFWMVVNRSSQGTEIESQHRIDRRQKRDAGMILRAIEWYEIDKKKTVFVSSSSVGIFAAKDAGITGIQYSGWRNDQAIPGTQVMQTPRRASSPEITEVRGLSATLERILGLGH